MAFFLLFHSGAFEAGRLTGLVLAPVIIVAVILVMKKRKK
jgi:hypothetical protein